jgi:hypothetical protein
MPIAKYGATAFPARAERRRFSDGDVSRQSAAARTHWSGGELAGNSSRPLRLTETSGSRGMRAGATCVHVDVGDERLDLAELEGRELFDWREVLRTPSRTASAPWSRTEQRAGRCSRRRGETIARIYLNHHGAELLEGGGPLETFILACSDGRLGLRSCHDAAA